MSDFMKISTRKDVIKKAFLAEKSQQIQPYGTDIKAGLKTSAHYHGRRDVRNTMMNRELARTPRIHGGGGLHFTSRKVPQARKGRRAHPPKSDKKWSKKINKKERELAIASAIASSSRIDEVKSRGHLVDRKELPIIVENSWEKIKKTKEVFSKLLELDLEKELERCSKKTIRSGRGKRRGRKYKKRKGPLIITSQKCGLTIAARNIPGIDVSSVKKLNVQLCAPGGVPGRLTIITKKALSELKKRFGDLNG